MRILGILPKLMERREPGGFPLGDPLGESPDQRVPLRRVKLARQRQHDLVADTGVLAIPALGGIEPGP